MDSPLTILRQLLAIGALAFHLTDIAAKHPLLIDHAVPVLLACLKSQ